MKMKKKSFCSSVIKLILGVMPKKGVIVIKALRPGKV